MRAVAVRRNTCGRDVQVKELRMVQRKSLASSAQGGGAINKAEKSFVNRSERWAYEAPL